MFQVMRLELHAESDSVSCTVRGKAESADRRVHRIYSLEQECL